MIKTIIIGISKLVLNFIYLPFKVLKSNNKIIFISRQFDYPNLDFMLLKNEIKKKSPKIKTVFLCKKLRKGIINKVSYMGFIFVCMYYLATSKVAIIDTYIIPISLLKHKRNLKIIQIWHALRGDKEVWTSNNRKVFW